MKELTVEKKPEKTKVGSSPERKPVESHANEMDYVGAELQPPERFVPLVQKLSHPANTNLRLRIYNRLQQTYGNSYMQKMISASNSQNIEQDQTELVSGILSRKGSGRSLDPEVMEFMQPRFGYDFSNVRIHTDSFAAKASSGLNAEAFTIGRDIFFNSGRYSPPAVESKKLIAHELTHTVQQRKSEGVSAHVIRRHGREISVAANMNGTTIRRETGHVPSIQRTVEVRPPGRGEASAFNRRQQVVDRLNRQSPAIQYRLDGMVLRYNVVNAATLTNFDRQMRGFIDRAEVVPMRLITRAGRVGGQTVLIDDFVRGYVDIDDLLASDDITFRLELVHFLAERFAVRNYERRIGTGPLEAEFNRAHRTGREAEAQLLRDTIGDPTIRFIYNESRPDGTWVVGFRSNEGYWIFKVFRRAEEEVSGGEVWVRTRDRRRLTIAQLRAERAAARAPAAPAPAPAPAVP
jgi:hypothetical protein